MARPDSMLERGSDIIRVIRILSELLLQSQCSIRHRRSGAVPLVLDSTVLGTGGATYGFKRTHR